MRESASTLVSSNIPFRPGNPLASRALSAFEFCFGAFIVIGHNVFHIVPNEVIILSLLGLISIRLRDGGWSAMGLKRPASWRRILLIALVAAILRILLGQLLIEPLTGFFWPKPIAPALANEITGNIKYALIALLVVWTFAAFGEEIAYRDRSRTRTATAVRPGERFVDVVVLHIGTEVARARDAENGVHVSAVEIYERAFTMEKIGDGLDLRLKQSQRVGIGNHEDTGVVAKFGFEIVKIN